MAQVELRNVIKAFGLVDVIHGIDIFIEDGEFVALVGPSGCGKSTLLRMIAGLEDLSGGEVRIADRVVNDLSPKDRDIAMVFQNYALYPHMKVHANMGFGLKMSGIAKAEADRRIRAAASILGLTDQLDRYPRQLSGGQRQRVAMGRAIVRDPKVFLFDEPLSNLDAKLRVQMRSEIRDLHRRLNATTIYVTHDQYEAMTMADKVVVLQGGRVEQIGAPLELYDAPRNLFVAGFIGSPQMNLIKGQVEGGSLQTEGGDLPLPEGLHLVDGQQVVWGVRPEHMRLDSSSAAGPIVKISFVEHAGSETNVATRFGDMEVLATYHERLTVKPGDSAKLVPDMKKVHLFDGETGLRIDNGTRVRMH